MTADPTLLAARARAAAAKARLDASMALAKAKLSPRAMAADAVETASEKASQVAHTGLQAARDRPVITAAAVGVFGLLLANKPIRGLISSWFDAPGETADEGVS